MGIIHLLDNFTANSIAAGEVVERPSSVVKELIENALDAGASVISIEIRQGGISMIRVSDNGCGFQPDDAKMAFLRHSTSKITNIDDLQNLQTMGFRGEALASIAAVSEITLESRQPGSEEGIRLKLSAGEIIHESVSACPAGTVIQVDNLFFNQPARYKFLKKDQTEASYITDLIERLALGRPDISFRLINHDRDIIHTPGNDDLMSCIFAVYGKDTANSCLPVSFIENPLEISGFITDPKQSRHNRNRQNIFINNRLIKSKLISAALDESIKTWFMKGKYPTVVLNISIPVALVDVNVHPQKLEVRFWDEKKIFHCVYHAVRQSLINGGFIPNETLDFTKSDQINNLTVQNLPVNQFPEQQNLHEITNIEKQNGLYADNYHQQNNGTDSEFLLHVSEQKIDEHKNNTAKIDVITSQHDNVINSNNYSDFHAEDKKQNNTRMNKLIGARIIGQAFGTYLILEINNEIYLVDQHAAHERIIYERLLSDHKKGISESGSVRQPLLIPITIHLTQSEKSKIESEENKILDFGFEFDDFGPDTVLLRSVPAAVINRIDPASAFRAIIDSIDQYNDTSAPDRAGHIFEMIACKAAVKANDLLHLSEMEMLLSDLQTLENPYHCPHGRPVIVELTKFEIEKMFKRIL
jgi:DNA mismatch repair protein MutL